MLMLIQCKKYSYFYILKAILISMLLVFMHADAETDPNVLVYAAVIIPLVFIILAALACVCFRK